MRSDPQPLRRLLVAVAAVAALAAVPGAFVRSTYGGAAAVDEPQYLLTAISLAEDRSLDIDDELGEARWRAFHDATLPTQTEPRPDGTRVAPHDPLLPLLLALPYELGGLIGARWFLALVNGALAAVLLHLTVRRFEVPPRLAAIGAAVAGCSVPFVVYGSQVYPELPAALAVTVAVDAGLARVRRGTTATVLLAVVALPWLSVKYVPVAATIALLHLWRLHREGATGHVRAVLAAYAVAAAGYVVGHLAWYGGVTAYAAGDFFADNGGQLSVLGTNPNLPGRASRLVGLLVDRGFGIAAWQPAWLALAPAAGALVARRPPAWTWVAAPLAVGWANATFVAVTMHGYWFPGRHLLHALPLAVVAILWWLARTTTAVRAAVAVAAGLGLWSTIALVTGGLGGELTWVVDFATVDHPGYRWWRLVLPDGLQRPPGTVALWLAWGAALVAAGVIAARAARTPPSAGTTGPRSQDATGAGDGGAGSASAVSPRTSRSPRP